MVFFNYALRKLNAKIVYYGPGLCGKTTNLQWVHDHFEGIDLGGSLAAVVHFDVQRTVAIVTGPHVGIDGEPGDSIVLEIDCYKGHRHLPIIRARRVA